MQFHVHMPETQSVVRRLRFWLWFLILFCGITGYGKVYTLLPGRGSAGGMENALGPKTIWSEPVIVNGVKMHLTIGLVRQRLDFLLKNIKVLFPGAKFAANSNTLLAIQKQKDGSEKRILLVYFGPGMPMIQFSIVIPGKLPRNFVWPDKLPRTYDAKTRKYIALPERDVWYGIFRTQAAKEAALGEMSSVLEADGWKPLSSSINSGRPVNGEIFYRERPPGIMIINCSPDGVVSSFFHPTAKKK